ncbi:MAG: polyprenyl synthetase family protein, partial [Acidimicrobiia bacterium]|nr:polyprenyl synthetase family protein [Acidimicrobiia bacterium]
MSSASPLLRYPVVQSDLARVEDALRASVVTEDDFLTEVASHLILAGGKRVRPAFAITAAAASSSSMRAASEGVIMGAVSVELVHLGSLYHD